MTHPWESVVRMGRALARRRRLAAMGVLALVCVVAGVTAGSWGEVDESAGSPEGTAGPPLIDIAATGGLASGAVLPEYASDLDTQVARIGEQVRDQLMARKHVAPERAAEAGQAFAASLKGAIAQPLTPEQFAAITTSLDRQRFARVHPHSDITDLEIQWNGLVWADFITRYLERAPVSPADQALLERQVAELVATVRNTMTAQFGTAVTAVEIENMGDYYAALLARDRTDPLIPVLKAPFSAEEFAARKAQAEEIISREVAGWRAERDPERPPAAATAVGGPINQLHAVIWQRQYQAPTLAPELMARMRDERAALITARAEAFDRLPEPQRAEEWERRLAEERSRP